jgi:glycogen synthase
VDLLTSGIFAAHFINTVSPRFLWEVVNGWHSMVPSSVRTELRNKYEADCAKGILNAPDPSYDPISDTALPVNYSSYDAIEGKRACKAALQKALQLTENPDAPIFIWPSRLDPSQKGPQLLAEILPKLIAAYHREDFQIAIIANGPYQRIFHELVIKFGLHHHVAVVDFDENLSRLSYAGGDFMLMPSLFEPCGLPQMVAPIYGTLPVVHATGCLYDTISHLDPARGTGNGFSFENYDTGGLRWAIDQAMEFFHQPPAIKQANITRIMRESKERFNHEEVAEQYIAMYEEMLARPLVDHDVSVSEL